MFRNLIKIIKSNIGFFGLILGIAIITIPSYYFLERDLIIGNFGYNYYLLELNLIIMIAILFGLFLASTLYKMEYFSVKKSGIGFFGGLLGILVSGCPACTITLASYMGLAGVIAIFPYGGIELKIISVCILVYVVFINIRDLETCKINKNWYT